MVTVQGITERYSNALVRILPPGPGVCAVCRGATAQGYPRCLQCHRAANVPGAQLADTVIPISLAAKNRAERVQLTHELWRYKAPHAPEHRVLEQQLAAVIWRFLHDHEACVARSAGCGGFDLVTTVPSTRQRTDHPLERMIGETIPITSRRFSVVLRHCHSPSQDRAVCRDLFQVSDDIAGRTVLVIDDTWTSGARIQSAAWALKLAGATRVAAVVIGRHFDRDYGENERYFQQAKKIPFSWEVCCVH